MIKKFLNIFFANKTSCLKFCPADLFPENLYSTQIILVLLFCSFSKNTPPRTRSSTVGRSEKMGMRVVTDELLREKVLLRNLENSKVTEILGLPKSGGTLTPPRSGGTLTPPRSGGTLTPPESRGEGPPIPPRRNSKSLRVRNRSRSPSFYKNYKSTDTDPNSKWVTVQERQRAGNLR